ncbi:site-specific DNA-methyltransferase [Methanocella sp. CWC-04]|uniref:Site-specific DNA-methyltransferase n=1 Tax=Methanooceanicella nereidis TaxID=2052831 RepID=A0AAP2RCH9_9EURY|nr:site-specific DNA-methyltransferase [Methanocella sp. CWC-04]MCD1295021.1 site-specific DNA-methyltransferase [Methanocella sp. CWC-04]
MVGAHVDNIKVEKINVSSNKIDCEKIRALKSIFPEVFSEGKIDFEKLKTMLGEFVNSNRERYYFTWAGKNESTSLMQTPSINTLKVCESESVDFNKTNNIFIEGDNLEVLKLLYKSYFGMVKVIYIDPPYNTGSDFIYEDNYKDPLGSYLVYTGQKDSMGNALTSKPEKNGRYHSSWLSMMYPRLFLARQLLTEDGVIFVSIDDHEVHNLRMIMNEIYGEENFIASIVWQKKASPQNDATYLSDTHDYILVYARKAKETKNDPNGWDMQLLPRTAKQDALYKNPDNDPRGDWASGGLDVKTYSESYDYPITTPSGRIVYPPKGYCWRVSKERFQELVADNRIWFGEKGDNVPRIKRFLSEVRQGIVPTTWWRRDDCGDNQEAKQELKSLMPDVDIIFDTPKPVRLIKRILEIATVKDENNLVMDFFAGSCTTAHAVLELNQNDGGNRRFIMVQLPEPTNNNKFPTISEISKERLMCVIKKLNESDAQTSLESFNKNEDRGFKVFKLSKSNFRQWQPLSNDVNAEKYIKQMELFNDPIIDGSRNEDVIYEVALKEGYDLNLKIEKITGVNALVWKVKDVEKNQYFYICLEENIDFNIIKLLNLEANDLFICRSIALNDTASANLALQCRLKLI